MRWFWIVFLPAGLAAQQPAVSPALPRLLGRIQDTTVSVWLFARPTAEGRCSERRIEGSIKGEGAVAEITPRLAGILEGSVLL